MGAAAASVRDGHSHARAGCQQEISEQLVGYHGYRDARKRPGGLKRVPVLYRRQPAVVSGGGTHQRLPSTRLSRELHLARRCATEWRGRHGLLTKAGSRSATAHGVLATMLVREEWTRGKRSRLQSG